MNTNIDIDKDKRRRKLEKVQGQFKVVNCSENYATIGFPLRVILTPTVVAVPPISSPDASS